MNIVCCACRSAFKSLAYKKYQQVPLYLEWAPKDIWDTPAPAAAAVKPKETPDTAVNGGSTTAAAAEEQGQAAAAAAGGVDNDEVSEAPVGWIYVKNLNFATTDAALKKHFDKAVSAAGGTIRSAKVCWNRVRTGYLLVCKIFVASIGMPCIAYVVTLARKLC